MTQELEIQPMGLQHSPEISKLTAALAKAENEFAEITKDCANPYYGNKYADLAALIAATKPALCKYELVVIQIPQLNGTGAVITTMLSHSSGEWLRSDLKLPASKFDAQGIGSTITYARRYSYQAILNIAAEEDDDGNAAVGKVQADRKSKGSDETELAAISPAMQRALISACQTGGRSMTQLAEYLKNMGRDGVDQLTKPEFNTAIKWALNSGPPAEDLSQELKPSVNGAKVRKRNQLSPISPVPPTISPEGELEPLDA